MVFERHSARGRKDARYVVNVPGRGYSFVAPVSRFTPQPSPPSIQTAVSLPLANLPARVEANGRPATVTPFTSCQHATFNGVAGKREYHRSRRHGEDNCWRSPLRTPLLSGFR